MSLAEDSLLLDNVANVQEEDNVTVSPQIFDGSIQAQGDTLDGDGKELEETLKLGQSDTEVFLGCQDPLTMCKREFILTLMESSSCRGYLSCKLCGIDVWGPNGMYSIRI